MTQAESASPSYKQCHRSMLCASTGEFLDIIYGPSSCSPVVLLELSGALFVPFAHTLL